VSETTVGRWFRLWMRRSPALRSVVRSPPVQALITTAREARAVRESLPYARRELSSGGAASYRLRESGLCVTLRHRTRDVDILREIFAGGPGGHCYEPPPEVTRALAETPTPRVLDLGGNIGLFGAWVCGRWPGARITSYEPDPGNARLLARTIAVNGLGPRWDVVEAAVATSSGQTAFAAGEFADSHIADDPDEPAITVPTVDMFELDHSVDLLKMDIEGGEWPILASSRLPSLRARFLLLEWHGPRRKQPGPAHEVVVRRLREVGYEQIQEAGRDYEDDVGVLWAWRP